MKRLILAGVLALACGASALAQTVKVGIIAPLSGPFSSNGKMWEATVKAYQKIHGTKVGDATVEVVWKDLADINPAQARALAQELIVKEKVQYLGGLYFTPDALAVGAIAQEAKVPTVIFNAATSSILDKSDHLLRTSYTLPQVSVPAARYALEQKLRTVVTLVSDYGPGLDSENAFVKTFTAGGGQVLEQIRAPLKTSDFGPFMQKIKTIKPDAVFVFGPGGPPTYAIIKAYSEAGLKQAGVRFIGTGETSELDLPAIGDAALGLETALHYSPAHESAMNQAFLKTAAELSPQVVLNAVSVGAYDGMAVIYRMVEATKGQRDPAKALAAAKGWQWESPRGPVKIDAQSRELVQNVYVRVVDKDASGRLRNREIKTYEMQPDHGRSAALQAK
ncbi:MAG: ABC transporter substrate-binding protein [Hydrogenophaga sp.]|uniref:ABC transporter substrate-binding protein n=1 Tax=Hydrogenophaga sp. TaxID=1904254 RepID=UPI0016A9C2BA|nr:ABC transporter substrate-binding protein [Hydrogenophaga sp.]NIM41904.1 ABC transporter substrate-binding protein [Hydrogenophaga sp.]NIN27207.1 ABC transporter substrate-binding protein [Hydrogenophaga sp.]NIN31908.1 ABC transporter substrate-binding protein [Hydrogenophaga sp.]NIN56301.1 ABC transporter substrate-binding protein [Hydrogenophaga sp.]NIO52281.1 ABC transporter substrate-binding protein [Hydrogenophaga sp.]